jgi:hypothetical protein
MNRFRKKKKSNSPSIFFFRLCKTTENVILGLIPVSVSGLIPLCISTTYSLKCECEQNTCEPNITLYFIDIQPLEKQEVNAQQQQTEAKNI